mmetsp:Transcript_10373/g.19404  ORF Transcript_10373/g.19404 Transcript_10373/m.19404 type:complete len:413 (+) Transcript_10373:52-1290(+)
MTTSCCPICAEDFDLTNPGKVQTCCSSVICQNCLYSHIKSILQEGITGDGRRVLSCPFACGAAISDLLVRECFQKKNVRLLRFILGRSMYRIFCFMGIFHSFFLDNCVIFWRLAQSLEERQDLVLYHRWSLTVALSNAISSSSSGSHKENAEHCNEKEDPTDSDKKLQRPNESSHETGDASQMYIHVLHCPRPNCECLWLVNKEYRLQKLKNENPKELRKKILLSCSSYFFKPILPEEEEEIMNQNGFTTEHWLNPLDVDLFNPRNFRTMGKSRRSSSYNSMKQNTDGSSKDGRLVTCPGCKYQFCGLCSRPWTTIGKSSGIRISHSRQLCSSYGQRASDDDEFLLSAEAGDARCCPGCSMRTNRTFGCNHMSCPCGYHWCYVCECQFDPRHYKCQEGNSIGGNQAVNCIIS